MDSKFCSKCRMVLSYDAYTQVKENETERQGEIALLRDRLGGMQTTIDHLTERESKLID